MTIDSSILILAYFANFKLAGDRVVRDAVKVLKRERAIDNVHVGVLPAPRPSARLRRRRRTTRARHLPRSARVGVMTDADLEAELAARRAARARERERYAKAMRSEKLSLLESELMRLRSEISRIDRPGVVGGGTPPTARWESLSAARGTAPRGGSPIPGGPPSSTGPPSVGVPPPPPPPMTPRGPDGDEPTDPERQKLEKEERLRRREAKRKEREQAKKPLTLAEIIRGAGPDPMKRLKPSGSTRLDDILEAQTVEEEDFTQLKESLKRRNSLSELDEKADESGEEDAADDESTKNASEKIRNSHNADEDFSNEHSDDENKSHEEVQDSNTKERNSAVTKNDDQKGSDKGLEADVKVNATVSPKKSNNPKSDVSEEVSPDIKEKHEDKASTSNQSEKPKLVAVNPSDALSAVSALAAKLPAKQMKVSVDANEQDNKALPAMPTSNQTRKRASLEERRRLRRETSNKSNDATNDNANGKTANGINSTTAK